MRRMNSLLEDYSELASPDRERLFHLTEEWHLLADLSFSDLILWVPDSDPNRMWAVSQIRPTTGPTALLEDVVGDSVAYEPDALALQAYWSGEVCETSDNKLASGIPVDMHAIPVRHQDRIIAVVEQHTNQIAVRANGALEDAYISVARHLRDMMARGDFPLSGPRSHPTNSPRVGDGLIWLGARGELRYATPNAVSAYRRAGYFGDIVGATPSQFQKELGGADEVRRLLTQHATAEREVSVDGVALRFRFSPLWERSGDSAGAVVLLRDITQIQRLDQQLITKDATIREIHHRVKNNLQTVAALLRMQRRRVDSEEAREALSEAMSRVASIASVHEVLSQSYDEVVSFDEVADRILAMVGDVASPMSPSEVIRQGSFGQISADTATNLSLVITELCQNAIEHAGGQASGVVVVTPERSESTLVVRVRDDGQGLPEDFDPKRTGSLGLGIVATLVADMRGEFSLMNNSDGPGVTATVRIPTSPAP